LKFKWETKFKETDFREVPHDWKERILYDLAEWINGYPFAQKKLNVNQIGLPVIKIAELNDGIKGSTQYYNGEFEPIYALQKGDLLFAWSASVGVYIWRGNKALLNQHIFKVLPKIDKRFLYFLLDGLKPVFQSIVEDKATTMGHVTIEDLKRINVYVPSLDEQDRIASVLSWFDDLIENKKRQNEVLEKTAMAIFKSWFMDFEPFKDEEFVDSPLGKMPKGWSVKPIGELAEVRNGISYSGKEKFEEPVDGSYVFITLNNAIEGGGFKPVYAWIKSDRIKEHHFLREGDLIIPNTEQTKDERLLGSPGIVFFPPGYEIDKGVYSMDIVKISPRERYYTFFLYLYLMFTREESASFHSGTSVLHFDINNFRKNKMILCPPLPILEKFHFLVEPLFQKIIKNQKQIMVSSKVRDVLLPLLVFGKLRVEEI